jgi:hypothetical protein
MAEDKTNFESSEAEKFDTVVRKVLSVSHKELEKREKAWQRQRATKAKPGRKPK